MHKKIITSENKEIHIFDNILQSAQRLHIYNFIRNSAYTMNSGPTTNLENLHEQGLSCFLNYEDVHNLQIFDFMNEEIKSYADPLNCTRAFILLENHKYYTRYHTDGLKFQWTMLYYANMEWDKDWGGETLFTNENYDEIEYAVMYKPGRFVLFDSTIPHKGSLSSIDSSQFRTIVSMNFDKK